MRLADSIEFRLSGTIVFQFDGSGLSSGTATTFLFGASRSVSRYKVPDTTPSGWYAAVCPG